MTTTPFVADVEDVVGDYLRTHAEIVALGAKVVGQPFGDSQGPWVLVTQLDVSDHGEGLEHLIEHMVQFDCYAGRSATEAYTGHAEANTLARTVRAALKDLQDQTLGGYVFNRVVFSGHTRLIDTDFEPARQRIALTADIALHG